MFLLLVCWIAVGLISGFAGSKMVNLAGDDPRLGIMVGGIGAIVGGGITHFLSKTPPNATDYWSILIALVTGAAAVAIWHFIRKSTSRA
jgi:uncharacterized membrane protein YeaQ/YmgE (transglycosylase-associated protein family)